MAELQKRTAIFGDHATNAHANDEDITQTLNTPTTPVTIHKAPRVHGQMTHNNKPGFTPLTTEGEHAGTTEGDKVEHDNEFGTHWYNEPRQKRKKKEKVSTKRGKDHQN